jgi:hypothetical protein
MQFSQTEKVKREFTLFVDEARGGLRGMDEISRMDDVV